MAFWNRKKDPKAALRELIGDYELPSFSATAMNALSLLRRDDVDVALIADEMRADPGIHVRVLRTVNAAGFGLRDEVASLERAINLLGSSRLEAIVLAVAVQDRLPEVTDLDLARFWRTATLRACLAKALSTRSHPAGAPEAFTAAFLQDMAVPILFEKRGAEYAELYYKAVDDPDSSLHELEQAKYGHDHATIGALMAESWGLPHSLVEMIASHHAEVDSPHSTPAWEIAHAVAALADEADHAASLAGLSDPWASWLGVEPATVAAIVSLAQEEAEKLAKALVSTGQKSSKAA